MPIYRFRIKDLFIYLGVPLLFMPKINFLSFTGQSAGIRIDDILILSQVILFLLWIIKKGFSVVNKFEIIIYCIIIFSLFSNLVNLIIYNTSNILYSVRLFEYFIFFYIGYYTTKSISYHKIAWLIFGANMLCMIFQKIGILGGFTSQGYVSDVSDRVIGLTGGPWEVGVLLNFLFSILYLSDVKYRPKIYIYIYIVLNFFLILITGARMPTLAFLLITLVFIYQLLNNKFIYIVSLIGMFFLINLWFLYFDNPLKERSGNLFSYSNISQFISYFDLLSVAETFSEFPDTPVDDNSDMSWLFRVAKWSYAIKYWSVRNLSWFIGLGPGIWGLALDGGWIRILTEIGIIGTIIYLYFLYNIFKYKTILSYMVFSFTINMFMIDIHMSYKCMSFLFFTLGAFYCNDKNLLYIKIRNVI